jgi:ABC-type proline/glycine betaine transport system substrate-binding protein
MPRVTKGSVGMSFLAYKIAKDKDGLACAAAKCQSGASVGVSKPCGDLMPSVATASFTDANRTKILDWIAQGASD